MAKVAESDSTPRRVYASPRQEERQRRILQVARREISAIGYDAITMQHLAQASEVSVKTLYNLYGSKDELLIAAVDGLLQDLEQATQRQDVASGVPYLLAFYAALSDQVVNTPHYAEVMAKALFQADSEHRLTRILLGDSIRRVTEQLEIASDKGELVPQVDITALARVFSAHQWGIILVWSKGLLPLEEFRSQSVHSRLMTLAPLCTSPLREQLFAQLEHELAR
jgi:AcrR family transcriptional regulator